MRLHLHTSALPSSVVRMSVRCPGPGAFPSLSHGIVLRQEHLESSVASGLAAQALRSSLCDSVVWRECQIPASPSQKLRALRYLFFKCAQPPSALSATWLSLTSTRHISKACAPLDCAIARARACLRIGTHLSNDVVDANTRLDLPLVMRRACKRKLEQQVSVDWAPHEPATAVDHAHEGSNYHREAPRCRLWSLLHTAVQ